MIEKDWHTKVSSYQLKASKQNRTSGNKAMNNKKQEENHTISRKNQHFMHNFRVEQFKKRIEDIPASMLE